MLLDPEAPGVFVGVGDEEAAAVCDLQCADDGARCAVARCRRVGVISIYLCIHIYLFIYLFVCSQSLGFYGNGRG